VARKDEVSPEVAFPVTLADIAGGTKWRAEVVDFDLKQPGTKVSYTIAIDYPAYVPENPTLWLAIMALALLLFAVGGGNDIVARLIGQWLSERLGQPCLSRIGSARAAISPQRRSLPRLRTAIRCSRFRRPTPETQR